MLNIGRIEVDDTTRQRRPNKDNKTIPPRIKLKDKTDQLQITATLRNLRDAEDKFRNVSVADDISTKDREKGRLLTEGENNWLENNEGEPWKYRVKGTSGSHTLRWIKKATTTYKLKTLLYGTKVRML